MRVICWALNGRLLNENSTDLHSSPPLLRSYTNNNLLNFLTWLAIFTVSKKMHRWVSCPFPPFWYRISVSLLLPRGQRLAWMPSEPCKSYQELTLKPLHTVLSCPIKKLSFSTSVFWSLFSENEQAQDAEAGSNNNNWSIYKVPNRVRRDYSKRTHTHTQTLTHTQEHADYTKLSLYEVRWGGGGMWGKTTPELYRSNYTLTSSATVSLISVRSIRGFVTFWLIACWISENKQQAMFQQM